jgi:peptidyl-tRNA hydrolase, PTH1 family
MALFQKRPQASDSIQYFTLGQNKIALIVGLGNIGKQYNGTRHNIGFDIVDAFAKAHNFPDWIEKKDLKSHFTSQTIADTRVILIKPTTFMNLSGEAVQAAARFYKVSPEQTVVVHDELDIPFGQIRTRVGGSAAGHNGIKSVSQHHTEQYGRIRVGIGPKDPPQIDSADFVLQQFSGTQKEQLPHLIKEATAIVSEYVYGGQLLAETRSFIV